MTDWEREIVDRVDWDLAERGVPIEKRLNADALLRRVRGVLLPWNPVWKLPAFPALVRPLLEPAVRAVIAYAARQIALDIGLEEASRE